MSDTATPVAVRLYGVAANLLAPIAYRRVASRLRAQDIPAERVRERLGNATLPRPEGRLIWFHAASVGESLSVLRLIGKLGETHPDCHFLITSGTATSARILADRMPPRCVHQFPPLDSGAAVSRFLAHWRPEAGIFVESELWPQMLRQSHAAGIPLALVNARLSDRSARNWKRFPDTARHLLGHFAMIHCQDRRTEALLHVLGVPQAESGPNLKSLSGPLPCDGDMRAHIAEKIADRPVWVAGSTHDGEDEVMLDAHSQLLARHPQALLILVPRHPERADAIDSLTSAAGLRRTRRSRGEEPAPDSQVYLADTLGETGLWFAVAPVTCLCGSFTDVGGHNPFEPAHAGAAILHGPRYANFAETYAALDASGAAVEVSGADTLAQELCGLFESPDRLAVLRDAARAFAEVQADKLDEIATRLSKALALR